MNNKWKEFIKDFLYKNYKGFYTHNNESFNSEIFNKISFENYENIQAEEIIYCFWTGDNALTKNRIRGLEMMKKNCEVKVELVTKDNLSNYILSDNPLHPAYEFLSNVHKSDYLRCYFMHHFGGGYSDVKPHTKSWKKVFKQVNKSKNIFAAGYRELSSDDVAYPRDFFENENLRLINFELRKNYRYLIGNGSYIFKPNTPFTKLWFQELNRRLDINYEKLKNNPGNVMGDNEEYPLPWNSILGQIFHPLCLIYHEYLMYSDNLKPEFVDYR